MNTSPSHLLISFLAISTPTFAVDVVAADSSETPLNISLENASAVLFGNVVAIRTGDCGALEGVGVADVVVRKAGRGIHAEEGEVIQVCSPAKLLLGKSYVFAGSMDDEGRLAPQVDSIVMADGVCNRYYRIDYTLSPQVAGEGGVRYYAIGQLVPDFASEYRQAIGIDLREFEQGSTQFCDPEEGSPGVP